MAGLAITDLPAGTPIPEDQPEAETEVRTPEPPAIEEGESDALAS
jgi:hypothetical protein